LNFFLSKSSEERLQTRHSNEYEARDVYVKFSSNRKNTATGFSCRIVGERIEHEEPEPPQTTIIPTTTTEITTTLDPNGCPGTDESMCDCGRIKDNERPWPVPFPWRQLDDNKIVGGQEALPHAYPWQVALTYYDYQVYKNTIHSHLTINYIGKKISVLCVT
jgi:hypothetical protein